MSIYEASITNPKKQLEFYKDLSEQLQKQNQKYKEVMDKLKFIENRAKAGATQETINKLAITFVNGYLKEVE